MDGLKKLIDLYEGVLIKNVKNINTLYKFDRFKMVNIYDAHKDIIYNLPNKIKYNIFLIREPKYRIIMSLPIKDKLVNHYVTKYYLYPKLEKYLIDNNIATRTGMGTEYGIKKIKKYIELNKKYDKFYILKLDISKYFYSIDHFVLKSLLTDKLDPKEYSIIEKILDSTNEPYINETINKIKNKYNNEEINSLPYYEYGKGLPIGNMTSQFLSIFYLYKLDHFIVNNLHLKYYIRYMDDFIIIHHDKKVLQDALKTIEYKLNNEYKLKINYKKTKILTSNKGFAFLGYNFKVISKKTIIKINSNALKKAKQNVRNKLYLYKNKKLDFNSLLCSYMTYYKSYKYGNTLKIRRYLEKEFFYKK